MKKQFVLSASEFEKISQAEKVVTKWFKDGSLNEDKLPQLYRVVEVYDLRLKFVKRKVKNV